MAIGTWDPYSRVHTPTANQPKAVRSPFEARLICERGHQYVSCECGRDVQRQCQAVATADLSAVGQTAPGQLDVPFGISEYYFTQFGCGDTINFIPMTAHRMPVLPGIPLTSSPPTPIRCETRHRWMTNGTYTSPGTSPGDTLNFINGNVASAFPNLINLYNAKKDGNGNWDVFVPVYRSPSCAPPNGAIPIIGYAEARITNVRGSKRPESSHSGDDPLQYIRGQYGWRRTALWAGSVYDPRSRRIIRPTEENSSYGSLDYGVD